MIENVKKQLKQSKSTDMGINHIVLEIFKKMLEKPLKSGRLMKYDEVAKIFAETELQLSQNHITYYKVGEEGL